ncbi:MAG: DNA polymerase III subunit delta [Treponema sp.]|nr:DNA polymerase III subunit delta [Treponema sp.]
MAVYLFLGPELGKRQDAVDGIKADLKKTSGGNEIENTVFYAVETTAAEIADTIQNISLFADTRIIIIKNAELIKKKDEIEIIDAALANKDKNTAVIFISDEIKLSASLEDAIMQPDVPKDNRRVFYELFEKEKNEWVRQFFKREGYNIDKECIDTILEMVENNTEALRRECSRLVFFAKETNSLSQYEIEKWLSHNREESAFTLFTRIAAGDLLKALESLSVLLAAKQSAQSILAGLAWCFRKLGDYINLLETSGAGQPNSFELKKIGLSSPKARDDYSAAARRYNSESAEKCLALTAECDRNLRSTSAALENLLMDRYILNIITAANNYR